MGEPSLNSTTPYRRWSTSLTSGRLAAIAVAAIGVARLFAAFKLRGPVLMPDEYFYTAISRSVADGGWPTVRGGHLDFIPVLAPILTSPAWLIHDVTTAYRVAQLEGVIAMTLAAVPAHALSRRVGLSLPSAAIVAIFAVLVPDLAFGGLLLSEPFAYPLFLTALLFAVRALESPTPRRQAVFLAVTGLLCLTRLQFAFLPLAYLVTAFGIVRPPRVTAVLRAHTLVAASIAAAAAAVPVVGVSTVAGRYSGVETFTHDPRSVLHWSGSNLVLLLVAAGWVTAPGGVLGLARQIRERAPGPRSFGILTAIVTAAVCTEAGLFGASLGQMEERYTFYAAPLVVIAFLYAAERRLLATRAHTIAAATLASVALLLPLDDPLFTGMRDQSPVLMAFALVQRHAQWWAPLVAGVLLLALAAATLELGRRGSARCLVGLAAIVLASVGVGYALVLVPSTRAGSRATWGLEQRVGRPASILAFAGNTVPGDLTTALFWNPDIQRVLVIGGKTVDGFPSVPVRLAAGGRLVTSSGPVRGAVLFQRNLETIETRAHIDESGPWELIEDAARARIGTMIVGWSTATGAFAPDGLIAAAAPGARAPVQRTVRLALHNSTPGVTRLRFDCSDGSRRTVAVGPQDRVVVLSLVGRGVASCRFAMLSGSIRWHDGYAETVQARVKLADASPEPRLRARSDT